MARNRVNLGRSVTRPAAQYIDIESVAAQFDGELRLTALSVRFILEGDTTVYESTTFTPGTPMQQLQTEVRRVAKEAAEALG